MRTLCEARPSIFMHVYESSVMNAMGILSRLFGKEKTINGDVIRCRYFVEHKLLPGMLLGEDWKKTVDLILSLQGDYFVNLYTILNDDKPDYQCPYNKDEFSAEVLKLNDDKFCVKITMPEPETEVLCSMIVLICDETSGKRSYITVEGSTHTRGAFICGWEDGIHSNYGPYSEQKLISIISSK